MDDLTSQRWLAYELHDGLLQWVIGARLQLVAAKSRDEPTTEQLQRSISKAIASLELGLVEARELIGYLERQPARGETRLVSALTQFIEGAQRDAELNQQRIVPQFDVAVPAAIEAALTDSPSWNLLRIAQQSIHNAITHAGPTRIDVELHWVAQPMEIVLIVTDHGVGFDVARSRSETKHFGLSSMSHRAELIGARLDIQSTPGTGCRVTCSLPIAA